MESSQMVARVLQACLLGLVSFSCGPNFLLGLKLLCSEKVSMLEKKEIASVSNKSKVEKAFV
jgi:hypothetical protein